MPPALPHGSHDRRTAGRELDRAARIRFRRAITLLLMTLVLPGSAQVVAGNKQVGRVALRVFFGCLGLAALLVFVAWASKGALIDLGTSGWFLRGAQLLLILLAVGWAYLFIDAWRLSDPLSLVREHRLVIVGLNGLLCFGVAGTLLFGSQLVSTAGGALADVFEDGETHAAAEGRYNVLLLGGDSGDGRWGWRPDSLTVASIDAETGRTVLVSLPRNMQDFPFADGSVMDTEFPDGFDCADCYLNGVATWAEDHPELFEGAEDPGIDATVTAVEGITDLDIDYWAMVDLQGFENLVDAVGGVTLNVRDEIPINFPATDYIEPGVRKLDGFETLWFARAREGSDDYSRMARQKCVMNALLTQVSPQTVLSNFGDIADAGKAILRTNIPRDDVGRFVELALKAKEQQISTLSLVPPMINTANPDMDLVHDKVDSAIDTAEGKAPPPAKKAAKPKETGPNGETQRGGAVGTKDAGYAANGADDLASAC